MLSGPRKEIVGGGDSRLDKAKKVEITHEPQHGDGPFYLRADGVFIASAKRARWLADYALDQGASLVRHTYDLKLDE